MKKSSPCKDCANRRVGCHGKCKAYIEYDESRKNELESLRMTVMIECTLRDNHIKRCKKHKRKAYA